MVQRKIYCYELSYTNRGYAKLSDMLKSKKVYKTCQPEFCGYPEVGTKTYCNFLLKSIDPGPVSVCPARRLSSLSFFQRPESFV